MNNFDNVLQNKSICDAQLPLNITFELSYSPEDFMGKIMQKQLLDAHRYLTVVLLLVGGAVGCSHHRDSSSPTLAAPSPITQDSGGVDGSGGNVINTPYDSFLLEVQRQRARLRDVVYRLNLAKTSSVQDAYINAEDSLIEEFFGGNAEDVMALIGDTKFFGQEAPCPSQNHPQGDSAVTKEKSICYSYSAFKRFHSTELSSQMLIVSLHELSHLRGFNEDKAISWQVSFSDETHMWGLSKFILVNNVSYRRLREDIDAIANKIHWAIENTARQNANWERESCTFIRIAREFESELINYHPSFELPTYLAEEMDQKLGIPLSVLNSECETMTAKELDEKLAALNENFISFYDDLNHYESPVCQGGICTALRSPMNNPLADQLLLAATNKWISNGETLPHTALSDVGCTLKDGETGEEIRRSSSSRGFEAQNWMLDDSIPTTIRLTESDAKSGPVTIEFGGGLHQVLEQNGFAVANSFTNLAYLQSGFNEAVSLKFALIKPDSIDLISSDRADPFESSLEKMPDLGKTFNVECHFIRH